MWACSGNLSWQYVNSMNCIVCVCVKVVMELEYGLGRLVCRGYMVLIWLGIGNLFVGMYILLAILGQFVFGSCYWGCLRLLECSIGCVCWLVMSEWWDVPPYCGELFLGLSNKGARTLIVNGAMYLCHFYGIVYNWGFGIWGAKRCFSYGNGITLLHLSFYELSSWLYHLANLHPKDYGITLDSETIVTNWI